MLTGHDGTVPPTFHVPAHPGSSGEGASRRMSSLKRKDNDAELAVRRLLHGAGYRYRVQYPVPGLPRRTIDIAFTRARLAVFIDGCFWHGCPRHGTTPSSNAAWWAQKLDANLRRDRDTAAHLEREGWSVIRAWEHDPPSRVLQQVVDQLTAAGRQRGIRAASGGAHQVPCTRKGIEP